jgi:putative FmdB family regulatory protein
MPYYEYVCADCHTPFELRRSMKEIDDPTTCPQCRSQRVARQISKVAAFAHGDGGGVSALGGDSGGCGSCGGGTCGTCASRN